MVTAPDPIDYRPISAMVQELPRDGRWTRQRRDRWMRAMTAVVDLLIVVDPDTGPTAIPPLPPANPKLMGPR